MEVLKVRITLEEDLLGTKALDPAIFEDYIGAKCPDSELRKKEIQTARKTAEGLEEGPDEPETGITVFHRTEVINEGDKKKPFIYDYQILGFFKEAGDTYRSVEANKIKEAETFNKQAEKDGTKKKPVPRKVWGSAKKKIDRMVFVFPRKIILSDEEGLRPILERPIRVNGPQGERVAIARSETIPAGTSFDVEIKFIPGSLITVDMIKEILDYGALKGLGQWRNASWGRISWEELGDTA